MLFMLPLAEGVYRLLLAVVQCCWQRVLDLWMWCLVQQDNLRCVLAASSRTAAKGAIEELAACDHVLQWCHKLYLGLHELYTHLSSASQLQLLAIPCAWPFLPTTIIVTPSVLWDLFTAVSMLLIFHVAAGRTCELDELSGQGGMMQGSRLVLVSFFCTALLRVSWAPLYSISGMLPKLYHLCSVLLTSSTVLLCTAVIGKVRHALCATSWMLSACGGPAAGLCAFSRLACILVDLSSTWRRWLTRSVVRLQVLFSRLDSMKSALEELVAGTRGVVLFSRTLLYLDWLLGMAGPSALQHKLLLMVKFFCYAMAVEFLSSSIDTYLVGNK
jgi:hypothetical protein